MSRIIQETADLTGVSVREARSARHDAFADMVHVSDDATDGVMIDECINHLDTARLFLILQGVSQHRRRKKIA